MNTTGTVFLDPDQKGPRAQDFEERLSVRIVGQERAVRRMSGLYQIFLAGVNPPNQPIGTLLFLVPTGSGTTGVIEATAEVLYRDVSAVVKINCAEFQHSHDIAKLSLLFDEIEKASDSLWQLLLGILDKATLTLGDKESD